MTTGRIEKRLADAQGRGALLPYFTSGFPDLDATAELIRRADRIGVAAVELGIPYSDSIADGPVIQSSFYAALAGGHRVEDALDLVRQVRGDVACGLIAMLSYSIVYRHGLDRFMTDAASAGFDGVILPDVPVEESKPTAHAAHRAGLCHIGLVAPTTEPERRREIVANTTGFVYQIAASGTTGERASMAATLADAVSRLRQLTATPICVGFGVSTPEHVREVCRYADGAIVGSALVRRIRDGLDQSLQRDAIIEAVERTLANLFTGLRSPA